jgi:hypothetical protein
MQALGGIWLATCSWLMGWAPGFFGQPGDLATDRAREAQRETETIESELIRRFVTATLAASKVDHSGWAVLALHQDGG